MRELPHPFERYAVTRSGDVINTRTGRTLKPFLYGDGYRGVNLCVDGKPRKHYVHRLVAMMYCDQPAGCLEVDHLNRDRADNRASNLKWVTRRANLLKRKWDGYWAATGCR